VRVRSPTGHQPMATLEDQMRSLNASYLDQQLESIQRNPYFLISRVVTVTANHRCQQDLKRYSPVPQSTDFWPAHFWPAQHSDVNATRATKPQPNPAAFRASIAGSSPNLIRASRPVRHGKASTDNCPVWKERKGCQAPQLSWWLKTKKP
jgi:hypothetical protein